MLHEWLRVFADSGQDAPSSSSSTAIVVAAIAAGPTTLLAAATLLNNLRGRRQGETASEEPTAPADPLNSDSAVEGHRDPRDARIAALTRFLMLRHFDPSKITNGSEDPANVRFR